MRCTGWLVVLALGGCDSTGSWSGDWSGIIDGHSSHTASGTWQRSPYCSGELSGTITASGMVELTGDCVVTSGDDEGLAFDAKLSGFIDDVTYLLGARLTDPDEVVAFGLASASGTMADPLEAEADTTYTDEDGDESEAFVFFEIGR